MFNGIWEIIRQICMILCWVAPFTFVFFLVYAVREAVNKGKRDIEYAFFAGISLFVIVSAFMLR